MKELLATLLILIVNAAPIHAKEHVINAVPTRQKTEQPTTPSETLPVATSDMVYINDADQLIVETISISDSIGKFDVSLISKENTKIKIRYNDENIVVKNQREIVKLSQGAELKIQFAVFAETRGIVEILNIKDEVIHTIPYVITKDSSVRQSIRVSGSHTMRQDSEDKTDVSVGYRVSTKPVNTGDGVHSFGVRLSTDTNFDSTRINIDYNYTF